MRSSSLLRLALVLTSAASYTAAWSNPLSHGNSLVVARADDDNQDDNKAEPSKDGNDSKDDTKSSIAPSSSSAKPSDDSKNSDSSDDDLNTAKPESSSKKGSSSKGASKTSSSDHHKTFAPDAPPGGVTMQTPATTALPTPLYKIGDEITFAWNYTSLQGDPSAVDVLLSCSTASETWTLTSNMSFKSDAKFIWDSNKQASQSSQDLPVALYTLLIKDSDADLTQLPDPGYLAVFSGLTFGLYTPQPYVSRGDYDCIGCSAGHSNFDRHLVVMVLSMSLVTIFSFTWFVAGLNLQ